MRLVVGSVPVTHHGHDIRERDARAVILIGVEEDTKALEFICRTEYRALGSTLLREPERKAVTMQVPLAMNLELELDLEERMSFCGSLIGLVSIFTCQLVAVSGTREAIQPCCDGRSAVRRMYLIRKKNVRV